MTTNRKRALKQNRPIVQPSAGSKSQRRGVPQSKRARGAHPELLLPFIPPEDWHEPTGGEGFRSVVQDAGPGYTHVVTPQEVQARLDELPRHFVRPLEVVQFSRMTRKKSSFPCYGMQWGSAIYLYPIEESLIEEFNGPPRPAQLIEARMYGGRWEQEGASWRLIWTPEAIKDFYLNNILIHELGHLLDDRNSSYAARERFAEWFAVRYGYQAARRARGKKKQVTRRHHSV